jgi:GGDEF domain-containing protein
MRGDSVIKYTAQVLLESAEASGDPEVFVGHVGGDDFVAVIDPVYVEDFCKLVVTSFDQGILDFYDTADALQGYIEVSDRKGERHAFPISSVSMGVATNVKRPVKSEWEASAIASEMKEYAKRQPGSSYQIDRRA